MDISSISGLAPLSTKTVDPSMLKNATELLKSGDESTKSATSGFESLLQSAMDMIAETNKYTNEAAEAELSYAMGLTNNTHELQVAQMKANISLQYTVAVRNAVMDAYKEIMQMQF